MQLNGREEGNKYNMVLQRWINKWYFGWIAEWNTNRTEFRVHIKGEHEELDRWYKEENLPSNVRPAVYAVDAVALPLKLRIGFFPHVGDFVKMYVVDRDVAPYFRSNNMLPVGQVERVVTPRDSAWVRITYPRDEYGHGNTNEWCILVPNALLDRIDVVEYTKQLQIMADKSDGKEN